MKWCFCYELTPLTHDVTCFKLQRDIEKWHGLIYGLMKWCQTLSKGGICTELYLKLWFECECYFCNITKSGWF